MRLLSLSVEEFGCVSRAAVRFGPRLNVLFGPNDLGKSSLIEAIRAALLLPHSSSARESFVPWNSDQTPRVQLAFQLDEGRFYRVKKSFGSGSRGESFLEFSKDGETWLREASARNVDGELRKLLRWGLPQPGGRSGPKGLPESFLTTILLPKQSAVTALFDRELLKDPDESGRERLAEALQAMARDEQFLKILADAQAKVDEAFTATGQWKRGKDAPMRDLRSDLERRRTEREQWEEISRASRGTEDRIRLLQQQRDRIAEELVAAETRLARVTAIAAAEAALTTARGELAAQQQRVDDVASREKRLDQLGQEVERLTTKSGELGEELSTAQETLSTVRRQHEAESGGSADAARRLRGEELKNRELLLAKERDAVRGRVELLASIQKKEDELARLRELHQQVDDELARWESRRVPLDEEMQRLSRRVEQFSTAERYLEAKQITTELERLEKLRSDALAERERGAADRSHAEALVTRGSDAPTEAELASIRELQEELRVAEAKSEVGLSIRLTPRHPLDVESQVDGGDVEVHREVDEPLTIDARREVDLRLPNIASLRVEAGSAEERRVLSETRARWQAEGVSLLRKHQCDDVGMLANKCAAGAEDRREGARLAREAADRDVRAEKALATLPDGAELSARRATLASSFDAGDVEAFLREFPPGSMTELASLRRKTEEDLNQLRHEANERDVHRARLDERKGGADRDLEGAERACRGARSSLGAAFDGDLMGETSRVAERLATLASDLDKVAEERASLDRDAERTRDEIKGRSAEAERRVDDLEKRQAKLRDEIDAARRSRDQLEGELAEPRKQLASIDLGRLASAVTDAKRRVDALDPTDDERRESSVDTAREEVERLGRRQRELRDESLQAEGALEEVGGSVARERSDDLLNAIEKIDAAIRERELDYQGWRLLTETLKEAEGEEATHLGKAITPQVKTRFAELTRERYGELLLGPHLESSGVVAGGGARPIADLSVGTQEQLSTIFRLALAEQLGNGVILDDQLTQTDPDRMSWFQRELRRSAESIQLIVVTCHPHDYLTDDEMPTADDAERESAGVRAVDLERRVMRR